MKLAEREGFEPSVEVSPHTRLAGEHLQPLGHLSAGAFPMTYARFRAWPEYISRLFSGSG
jgi:hypothetical protein